MEFKKLDIFYRQFSTHILPGALIAVFSLLILDTSAFAAENYLFPSRRSDLGTGHYWVVDEFSEGPNILDISVKRWDSDLDTWTSRRDDITKSEYDQDPSNDKHLTFDLPLYAPEDGEIVTCWRNAPDNPTPGEKLPSVDGSGVNVAKTIFTAGNHVYIRTAEGRVFLVAHMKEGSVPAALCPFNDAFAQDATDRIATNCPTSSSQVSGFNREAFIPEGQRPRVRKGERIGNAGNSGNSGGPHIHIHLRPVTGTDMCPSVAIPFHGAWRQDYSRNDPVSSDAWKKLDGKAITDVVGDSFIYPSPFLRRGEAVAGAVSEVAITDIDNSGAITAVRDKDGNLKLITWGVAESGEIVRKKDESAGAASNLAITHPGLTRDVVTALRDGSGNLKLIAWDITQSGGITRKGDASAGAVSRIAMTRIPSGIGVLTAVRDASGNLKLIAWDVTQSGNIIRKGDASAGAVSEIAIAKDVNSGFNRVVTAVREASGNLKLIVWDVSPTMQIVRKDDASAGAVSAVSIATVPVSNTKDLVVTAVRDGGGNLKLIVWEVSSTGQIVRKGDITAGAVSEVEIFNVGNLDLVTAVRDGSGNLRLISWQVDPSGQIRRHGDAVAGTVSQIAMGNISQEFIVAAFRDGEGNLKMIAWETNLKP